MTQNIHMERLGYIWNSYSVPFLMMQHISVTFASHIKEAYSNLLERSWTQMFLRAKAIETPLIGIISNAWLLNMWNMILSYGFNEVIST